ncbi:Mov34/MPN/PAD-1 family protein [Cohnella nanjingensis]|uniref:M67 family metallopeptidase n=1 Tax=Cohnella nanjingensis TaxID=1387779 RepID=A0A7X0VJ39_9BACL|nr:M67 family metallopeptidase [Cohnella nanjingensis]MBB6674319.1 M67 family metallopeptidase [Cohnella nanjingensis]
MTAIAKVYVSESMLAALFETCRRRLPYESCGIVLGACSAGAAVAETFVLLRNVSADPLRSFRFDPAEWTEAYGAAQKNQREIVGFFHVHPDADPVLSPLDLQGWDGSGTCWVIGFPAGDPILAVYSQQADGSVRLLPVARRP